MFLYVKIKFLKNGPKKIENRNTTRKSYFDLGPNIYYNIRVEEILLLKYGLEVLFKANTFLALNGIEA